MRNNIALLAVVSTFIAGLAAAEVYSPEPGSAERSAILNSGRVMVGYDLGGPIEFVVTSLEVDGDVGFFSR